MTLALKAYGVTDIGRRRRRNEDSLLLVPELGLFAVADGMGGHASGDVASQRAVAVVHAFIAERMQVLHDFAHDPSPEHGAAAALLIEKAIQAACSDIFQQAAADMRLHGMGTTLVCLVVVGERGVVAHVGDSRLYLHRRGSLYQLTEDHTLMAEQIKAGKIDPEAARNSPLKNMLTRAIGALESVQVDTLVIDLHPGDHFLLCSDGLYGYFDDKDLVECFLAVPAEQLPAQLVAMANDRGGRDNITAVVVALEDCGDEQPTSVSRIDALQNIPLFEHLSYREHNEILAIAHTRTYASGEIIVQEGEPGGDLFVLLDGEVNVEQRGTPLASLLAGGHFGEMGLVDAGMRSATVRAMRQVRAMVIHREDTLGLMQREPKLAVKLLWAFVKVLSQRLRVANQDLAVALAEPQTLRF